MAILIAAEVMSDTAPYRNEQGFGAGAGVETQWPARSNVERRVRVEGTRFRARARRRY